MGNNEPNVIYEDDVVLVINKPAGLVVHGDGRTEEVTLADWIIRTRPGLRDIGEPWTSPQGKVIPRPGIVHRLDRDTSGVMVIGKTQEAFEFLKRLFQDRAVTKRYTTIVYGHMKEREGVIDKPIGRSPRDFRRWSAQPGARGDMREARTRWSVQKQGIDQERGEPVSVLMAEPETGRTHQIRVHLKAIHHPVVCDPLYGEGKPCLLGLKRVALHASSLTVTLPNGQERTFEAPLPKDLVTAVASIV